MLLWPSMQVFGFITHYSAALSGRVLMLGSGFGRGDVIVSSGDLSRINGSGTSNARNARPRAVLFGRLRQILTAPAGES
jgi:hypothetical protein